MSCRTVKDNRGQGSKMSKEMTREGILQAALELFSDRGYSGVSTRNIADRAGVSEMTLFRHFETKRDIFKSVLEELLYPPAIRKFEADGFTWDLRKDLETISAVSREVISQNSKIIKMNMKDINGLSENDDSFMNYPESLKKVLVSYFTEYSRKNRGNINPELLATVFLSYLIGLGMNNFVINAFKTETSYEEASKEFIDMFVSKVGQSMIEYGDDGKTSSDRQA